MGFAAFKTKPSSEEVTAALDRIIATESVRPKYLIDRQFRGSSGRQFQIP
jgi:hypothetical protein